MKKNFHGSSLLSAGLMSALAFSGLALAQETLDTRIGKLTFTHDFVSGYPTQATVDTLFDARDFQRATQLYLWALPMVSLGEVEQVLMSTPGANRNDIFRTDTLPETRRFLTANATTPYVTAWLDLQQSGPLVLEIPAGAIAGLVNDLWQRPVADIGLPGPDKGLGGKYLVLGPGQAEPEGADDYIVVRSTTFNNLWLIRLLSPDDRERESIRANVRLYPFSQRAAPPPNKLLSVGGGTSFANAPRGLAYWEKLSRWVNAEPVQERDRIMMAMLRSLGIEKGKPFQPDARMQKLLTEATLVGEAMAKVNGYERRDMPQAYYAEGSQWKFALNQDLSQEAANHTQLDERSAWFYEATATSKGMMSKTPGVGSAYLSSYKDHDGNWLDGANSYRLHVPANPPASQFWSVTAYDVSSRALIQNNSDIVDRSSRHALKKNADGSVDVYFGPKAPAGFEQNWIPTLAGKAWFPYFRLFGPTEAHFDKSWTLPDIEKI
ncbi:DUF1254 domain-containing protein [Pseudomonas jessenii]|uniref:DUF1254 domain-containing protein n=1 Tax=Pseudomonas jessenii TaxID=77298 RepID=UPI0038928729